MYTVRYGISVDRRTVRQSTYTHVHFHNCMSMSVSLIKLPQLRPVQINPTKGGKGVSLASSSKKGHTYCPVLGAPQRWCADGWRMDGSSGKTCGQICATPSSCHVQKKLMMGLPLDSVREVILHRKTEILFDR